MKYCYIIFGVIAWAALLWAAGIRIPARHGALKLRPAAAPAPVGDGDDFITGMDRAQGGYSEPIEDNSGVKRWEACKAFLGSLPPDLHRDLPHGRVTVGRSFQSLSFSDRQAIVRALNCDSLGTPRFSIFDRMSGRKIGDFDGSKFVGSGQ